MTETREPNFLKQDPWATWEQETAEVLAMVNNNPNRRADVEKMTITLENDKMFLTYPGPTKSDVATAVFVALVFLLAVAVLVAALAAPTIGPRLLAFCITTLLATAIVTSTKGEKKNVHN